MSHGVLCWFELRWPREVDAERLVHAFRLLAASNAAPVILEAVGVRGGVVHRLALPSAAASMLVEQLRTALPAVGFERLARRPAVEVDRAVEVRLSTTSRPVRVDETESVCRAVLTALAAPRRGESVVLQWQLVGALAPAPVGNQAATPPSGSWASDLLDALMGERKPLDTEARGALRTKRSLYGWQLVGRIGAHAEDIPRQRQLIQQVVSALRSGEAPGVRLFVRATPARGVVEVRRPWRVRTRLNVAELAALAGWPVGDTRSLPIARQASRLLAPARAVPARGRVVGTATFPGRERAVALGVRDSLRHLHVIGPTGVGKSTLLLNLIGQDLAAGRAVVVIEPKDLIDEVLARVPPGRLDDVVLIDPTDPAAVVGVNPLAADAGSAEVNADRLLSVFHHLYAASWGPRMSDILFASCLTLARTPGMSLATLPLLLSDAGFRRRVVGGLDEPLVLQPFWQAFEAWSEAERTAAIAPVMNKVRPLLVRANLRAVLGQASPRFDLRQVFSERKILLVSLNRGVMGPEAAGLLGAVVVSQLWQTALERSAIPVERRHPVCVFVDEFQDFLTLPTDLAEALAQSRGLGLPWTLAHQHLGQLAPAMRSAVLANARSRVVFQLAAEDARAFADTLLEPDDLRSLGAFEAYAQLVAGDAVQPWLSLRTLPAAPTVSDPEQVRARSRERYATPREQVDSDLKQLRAGSHGGDLGPRGRTGGGR